LLLNNKAVRCQCYQRRSRTAARCVWRQKNRSWADVAQVAQAAPTNGMRPDMEK
jgi:hypothetical protein